jgi:putative ABC transport system permease protein
MAVAGLTEPGLLLPRRGALVLIAASSSSGGNPPTTWSSALSLDALDAFGRLVPSEAVAASVAAEATLAVASEEYVAQIEAVNPAYFAVLGALPKSGRLLSDTDAGSTGGMVVADRFARRLEPDEPDRVVGRTMRVGTAALTIVGIAPSDFGGLSTRSRRTDAWIPFGLALDAGLASSDPSKGQFNAAVRPTTQITRSTIASALAHLPDITRQFAAARGQDQPRGRAHTEWTLVEASEVTRGGLTATQETGLVVLASLVFVIAVVNLWNLTLARTVRREASIKLRLALGSSRRRLIAEEAAELAIVAVAAGVTAAIATVTLTRFWTATLPMSPSAVFEVEPRVSATTIGMLVVLPLVALAIVGVLPAVRVVMDTRVGQALTAAGAAGTTRLGRSARTLMRWQVGIVGALLVVGVVLIGPLARLASRDTGVRIEALTIAQVALPDGPAETQLWHVSDLIAAALGLRGVESATASVGMPFGIRTALTFVRPMGIPGVQPEGSVSVRVAGQYFETLGIRLMEGRSLTTPDSEAKAPIVVVSAGLAKRLFPGRHALGGSLELRATPDGAGEVVQIVGIAADTDVVQVGSREGGVVYRPLSSGAVSHVAITVSSGAGVGMPGRLRAALLKTDPRLTVTVAGSALDLLAGIVMVLRAATTLAFACAGSALLLAMIGLYGIAAQLVNLRRREIGVRLALGATRPMIMRWVLGRGLGPVGEGLAIAAVLAAAGGIAVTLGKGRNDVFLYLLAGALSVTAVGILLVAVAACYFPARYASRLDPAELLRCQ